MSFEPQYCWFRWCLLSLSLERFRPVSLHFQHSLLLWLKIWFTVSWAALERMLSGYRFCSGHCRKYQILALLTWSRVPCLKHWASHCRHMRRCFSWQPGPHSSAQAQEHHHFPPLHQRVYHLDSLTDPCYPPVYSVQVWPTYQFSWVAWGSLYSKRSRKRILLSSFLVAACQ